MSARGRTADSRASATKKPRRTRAHRGQQGVGFAVGTPAWRGRGAGQKPERAGLLLAVADPAAHPALLPPDLAATLSSATTGHAYSSIASANSTLIGVSLVIRESF